MPKRPTVDEEEELVPRKPKKFLFTADEVYARVNMCRRVMRFRLNRNAELMDQIPMMVGQSADDGQTCVRLHFPFPFTENSPMHNILDARMRECMPEDFKRVDNVVERLVPTGWCILPAHKPWPGMTVNEAAFVCVWWRDPNKLVKEVKEVCHDDATPLRGMLKTHAGAEHPDVQV